MGELSPLTLSVSTDRYVVIPAIKLASYLQINAIVKTFLVITYKISNENDLFL
jgi:hypothetical protein